MLRNFRTFNTAVAFYQLCHTLPLRGPLKDQLDRAGASIVLNLSEGRGRESLKDQKRFFHIALGSVRECQAVLILARAEHTEAWKTLDSVAAQLFRLIQNAR